MEGENLKLPYDLHIYATTCMHMWTNICLINDNYFKTQKASKKIITTYIISNITYTIYVYARGYVCVYISNRYIRYI